MVDIVMTGMCKNCKNAELELDCLTYESIDADYDQKFWTVKCTHSDVCEMWKEKQEGN